MARADPSASMHPSVPSTFNRSRARLAVLHGLAAFAMLTTSSPAQSADDPGPAAPAASPAHAIALDRYVVTATRASKTLFETPATASVITRDELDFRQAANIEDLVRYEPGVTIGVGFGADPFKQMDGFKIRGIGGNRVQIRIDGDRVSERIGDGTRDYVDVGLLKRAEIVRGPGSVLWGADALAGAVAYTTKDPSDYLGAGDGFGGALNTSYADVNDQFSASLAAAARNGKLETLLAYTYRAGHEPELRKSRASLAEGALWPSSRDPLALPTNKFDPRDIEGHSLLGKLVHQPSAAHESRLTAEWFGRTTDVDQLSVITPSAAGIKVLSQTRYQDVERWRVAFEHRWTADLPWLDSLNARLSHSPTENAIAGTRHRQLANGNDEFQTQFSSYAETFTSYDVQLRSLVDSDAIRQTFIYGIEGDFMRAEREPTVSTVTVPATGSSVTSGGGGFPSSRTRRFDAYAQDEIKLLQNRLTLLPGVRLASYRIDPRPGPLYTPVPGKEPVPVSKTDAVYKFAATWNFTPDLLAYASYSEGFKMPTSSQLYTSSPGTTFNGIPNPDLRPELVTNREAGLRWRNSRFGASLAAFTTDYEDFIQGFFFLNDTDYTSVNISSVHVYGFEGSFDWTISSQWSLRSTASIQRGSQKSSPTSAETYFDQVEPLTVVTTLAYTSRDRRFRAELVNTSVDRVRRASAPTILKPWGYSVFDFIASYAATDRFTLRLNVGNVLDQRYLPAWASSYYQTEINPSAAVANGNPIELRIASGLNVRVGAELRF